MCIWAKCACESAKLSAIAPDVFVQPRPTSATVYSNPRGRFDAHMVLIPCHRIADRLATSLNDRWHFKCCSATLHVHVKVNLSKDWVVYSLVRRREHLEDR